MTEHRTYEGLRKNSSGEEDVEERETRVAQPSPAVCLQLEKFFGCEDKYQGTTSLGLMHEVHDNDGRTLHQRHRRGRG
jgi:hypothetical protein